MSFSFPPNPSVGEVYTANGRTWQWSGLQWTATKTPSATTAPAYVSVSPPPDAIQGSLWYDSNNANLNIYYTDLNGGQWISVTPYPQDSIDQNGGVFQGPIYAQYEVPNNSAAFTTVGWFNAQLPAYLNQQGYMKSGDGITLSPTGEIVSFDSGLIV